MPHKLDGLLEHYANSIGVPTEFRSSANEVFDKVVRAIQADDGYSIDRVVLAGGMAKKTSVGQEGDYDVVAYVNGAFDLKRILDHFYDVIRTKFGVIVAMSRYALQFTISGFEFDLLFSQNRAEAGSGGASVVERQYSGVMDHIRSSGATSRTAYEHSSGLSEVAVAFVKRQSPFVHQVAKLAKVWNSNVPYSGYISGQSTIFELIGIQSGIEAEKKAKKQHDRNPSIVNAFVGFFSRVMNLKNQKIAHYEFYNHTDVPDHVRTQRPLVLDPSSPYNNLMHKFPSDAFDVFRDQARKSQSLLGKAQNSADLEKVFKP